MSPEFVQTVTNWFFVGLEAAALAVVAAVVPDMVSMGWTWAKAQIAAGRAKIDEEHRPIIDEAVRLAVQAAEQSGLAGLIMNIGEKKKEYALAVAQKYLDARGVRLNVALLAAEIERAILQGIHKKSELPASLLE